MFFLLKILCFWTVIFIQVSNIPDKTLSSENYFMKSEFFKKQILFVFNIIISGIVMVLMGLIWSIDRSLVECLVTFLETDEPKFFEI